VRSLHVPFLVVLLSPVAVASCGPQVRSAGAVAPANCQPLPGEGASAGAAATSNDSPLVGEPLASPTSKANVHFAAPDLAEEIPLEARLSYEVRLLRDGAVEPMPLIDVALDGGRPRRLSAAQSSIALGQLVPADAELSPGAHWLFAAPVLASGLVPRPGPGLPRAGSARRFFIGKQAPSASGPTGALWLRKPEGTYNGASAADRVLFDVFAFSASGAPLDAPYAVTLHGPSGSGQLRYPSPFSVHDVPSGDYQVVVSSPTALPLEVRFAVNRELGVTP
jgi:hypothetical protein